MSLKKKLYEEYKGFTDKRIKKLDKSDIFTVDDRHQGDFGADRKLFYWFCEVYARVIDDYSIEVELIGGVPTSPEISNLLTSWNARVNDSHVTFIVDEKSVSRLDALATALKNVVAPGRRYSTNWYKHVCPRTAESLLRLKSILDAYWSNPPKNRPLINVPLVFSE
jgi:hypothetical protein